MGESGSKHVVKFEPVHINLMFSLGNRFMLFH